MNVNSLITKDYIKYDDFAVRKNKPNSKPISSKAKMNANAFSQKDYENVRLHRRRENKPNQTRSKAEIPTGELLGILKPGTNQTQRLSEFFLFFTFLGASYNPAMQNWTIQKLLNWITEYFTERGIDSPRLNAELLLSHVVGLKRIELYTQFEKIVAKEQLDRLHDLVKRAGQHEPIAYIIGRTEFYSLQLYVTPDCMIPRPETELLVERAIEFLRKRSSRHFVCDLGTGSGCIAIAIARNYPDADITATDISEAALKIAAKNIEKYQLGDRIRLLCGDLFDPIMSQPDVDEFDLIVCNPPYVSAVEFEKLDKTIKDYEPKLALYAGEDGLDICRRIVKKVDQLLKSDAALMLEVGYNQGQAVRELLEQAKCFSEITIEKDFSNNDRVVTARKI